MKLKLCSLVILTLVFSYAAHAHAPLKRTLNLAESPCSNILASITYDSKLNLNQSRKVEYSSKEYMGTFNVKRDFTKKVSCQAYGHQYPGNNECILENGTNARGDSLILVWVTSGDLYPVRVLLSKKDGKKTNLSYGETLELDIWCD